MSECMKPVPMKDLIEWIPGEYIIQKSVFGIPEKKFFHKKTNFSTSIFNESLDLPLGPAAGPHTQMCQNIIAAYLCGARFFELKTVQKIDDLTITKPCIEAEDEAYNVEWSQELSLRDSYREYVKAWILIHFLDAVFGFSGQSNKACIFNMSVGYDLEGIKHEKMDGFIEGLKDASGNEFFEECRNTVLSFTQSSLFSRFINSLNDKNPEIISERLLYQFENISPMVSNSVTLSTMHGCPAGEIENIAKYLINEKGLNTFVKLNPTLLGYQTVERILNSGSGKFTLDKKSFQNDLQFANAVTLIKNLKLFAESHNKAFGIKLSNTLPVKNTRHRFPDSHMYMSGRTLYPLTMNLAYRLSEEFNGRLSISFSGGANANNILQILETGIYPVTLVTDLLKPGGYMRLKQMADLIEENCVLKKTNKETLDVAKLKHLASQSITDPAYSKVKKTVRVPKVASKLSMFDCYTAPCKEACPINQDIPEYISLVKAGLYSQAFEQIVRKNPLPNITGYICDHKCMSNCVRCGYDEPVQIREMKKVASEKGYAEYLSENKNSLKAKPNGIKAAIIGAGPAGLSAGYFLAKAGFDVTVFEASSKAGGTVRHIIPNFRIPRKAIDNDVEFIEFHGVKFVYNFPGNFSIHSLKEDGYKYIYVAIGASQSIEPVIKGGNNIFDAIEFLRSYNSGLKLPIGKNVAVIGGGNSAMDSARSAGRIQGVENVYIIYRRTREFMPADKEEYEAAISEGVIFRELLLPVQFNGNLLKCQKMELTIPEADGRMGIKALSRSFEEIEIDTVIYAIGEHTDFELMRANNLMGRENLRPTVNMSTNESLLENVFIGGDALRGPSSVINAISDGKKTAEYIISKEEIFMEESDISQKIKPDFSELIELKGQVFQDNVNSEAALAGRCLNCNLLCSMCVEVCPNRANIAIPTEGCALFRDKFQILHVDSLCNDCGNCETFCPHEGAPSKDKLTLFYDEKSFSESNNNGFLLDPDSGESSVVARYRDETGLVMLDRFGEVICTSFEENLRDESFDRFIKCIILVLTNHRYLIPESVVKKSFTREKK